MLIPALLCAAQDSTEPSPELPSITLLNDSLLFVAEVLLSSSGSTDILWETTVKKITIPGREVTVSLEGKDARLKVDFTLYPASENQLLLVAKNQTWISGTYNSTLTSLPIEHRKEVHYYPLGRVENTVEMSPVEILMKINVVPYLETLDEKERRELESVLQSTSKFQLGE